MENATSYDERTRLRAQLRLVKKGGSSATTVEKTGATTSRTAGTSSKSSLTTNHMSRSVQRRSPSPVVAEQRSTASIVLSASKPSPPPAVQESIKDRPSSGSSRGSSSRGSPSPHRQTSGKRDVPRTGVNGEQHDKEGDRVSEDDDIAQLEDMVCESCVVLS